MGRKMVAAGDLGLKGVESYHVTNAGPWLGLPRHGPIFFNRSI